MPARVQIPRGGLKAFFRANPARPFEETADAIDAYCLGKFGQRLDKQCKDLSRLCYFSHDPDLYVATGPVSPIPYPPATVPGPSPSTTAERPELKAEDIRELLRFIEPRPEYDDWLKIITAVASVLPESEGIPLLEEWSPEESTGEYATKWNHRLDDITVGTLFYFAGEGGWVASAAFRKKMPDAAVQEAARLAILAKLAKCEFGVGPAPAKPNPRLSLAGIGISTPGNITSISAQAKSGKTAVIGAIVAAVVVAGADAHELCSAAAPDTLGFTAADPGGKAVIHLDTEQSLYDQWRGNERALARAGTDTRPPWLRSFSMAGSTPHELREALRALCAAESAKQGIFAIIVDGVADMVSDVNEPGECNALIAELHSIAIRHDCIVVGIVHENPGQVTGKSRGHLGSQLERKSETNLRLVRKGEITQMFADKTRGAPIPEKHGPCFAWNDAAGMHVGVPTAAADAADKKVRLLREIAEECIPETGAANAINWAALKTAIINARGVSGQTAERRIGEMVESGVIHKSGSHYYREPTE